MTPEYTMSSLVSPLPRPCIEAFGTRIVTGRHRLQERELFSDTALVALLDHFPREHLYAHDMGDDPARIDVNRLAQHDGVGGAELLQAVKNGRLWLNVTRIDRVDGRCRLLIDQLYDALCVQMPAFDPLACGGTLLISSPHAMVHYHVDGPSSVLWHVRGRKRVWVYPAIDQHFLRRELLEDIFAGARHEFVPYVPALDSGAEVFDLEPGQWIAWPQNSPHRISNLDSVNVSLVTEHSTPASQRRTRLYLANRFLRTRLGVSNPSPREEGAAALAKIALQRVARKLGLDRVELRHHVAVDRVVAAAPGGVMPLANGHEAPGARSIAGLNASPGGHASMHGPATAGLVADRSAQRSAQMSTGTGATS